MHRHHFFFGLIRIPFELMIIVGAFWIARYIRITTDLIPGVTLPSRTLDMDYLIALALGSFVIIGLTFASQRLYTIEGENGILEESFLIMKSVFVSFFIAIGIIYLTNGFPYDTIRIPRLILIYAYLMIMGGILIERLLLRWVRNIGFRRGWLPKKKIILILNHSEPDLEKSFLTVEEMHIVGYLAPFEHKSHFPYLGTISHHAHIIHSRDIDEVIVLSHDLPYELRKVIFEYCQINGVDYRYVGNPYETAKKNAHIDFVGQIPLIEIRTISITPWGRVVKRTFDLTVGVLLALVLLPIFIVLVILIMIESPGNPFYVSERVGKNGKHFRMLKFRSMIPGAEKLKDGMIENNERPDGPLFKLKNDPRITKFGHWMRRWSVDELAQIFNVIRGDMSFMGPRPHLPEEVAKYSDKQRQVLTIKPGITGMAQVYGRDSNTFDREIELDLFYIENWGLMLDTKILLLTFRAVFQGK